MCRKDNRKWVDQEPIVERLLYILPWNIILGDTDV